MNSRFYGARGAELLEQSDVHGAEAYRRQLRAWLEAVPDPARQADLRSRLASLDDAQHYSARLEITVDGLFRGRGWQLDYHPRMGNVTARPDFWITTPTRPFICEAVLVRDDDDEQRRERRLLEIVDDLLRVRGRFLAWLRPLTPLPDTLPARRIRAFLKRELSRLDPALLTHSTGLLFEDRSVRPPVAIEFVISPRSGDEGAVIQMWGDAQAREITTFQRIRATLEYKAAKYGRQLMWPYLIVAWIQSRIPPSDFQIQRALWGDLQVVFQADLLPSEQTSREQRLPNGVFTRMQGGLPANEHVSAVAFYRYDLLDTGPSHSLQIYHNPYARRPLSRRLFKGQSQLVSFRRADKIEQRWIDGDSSKRE